MRFSLIVATKGRTKEFAVLLDSLEKQTFKDFELIIADQNEGSFLKPYLLGSSFPIIHLRAYPGAAHARNAGIPYASGDIITFPDDDCTYPYDLLENLNSYFKENTKINVVTISARENENNQISSRFDTSSGEVNRYNIWARSVEFTIFFERNWLQKIQFDPDLGVGAHTPWQAEEGPDLILRLQALGANVRYEASFFIFHYQAYRTYDAKALQRAYGYACGRGFFLRKHNYPFWYIAYTCSRSFMGFLSQGIRLNWQAARYYWAYFKGKAVSASALLSKWFFFQNRKSKSCSNKFTPYQPPVLLERISPATKPL